jgi:transposase
MPRGVPSTSINAPTRAAIVVLRCEGYGWTRISERVGGCSPAGAQHYFERVLKRAQVPIRTPPTELPIKELLTYLEDPPRPGREERFDEFSEVAETLVNNATQDNEGEDLSFKEVIKKTSQQLDIYIPETTGYDVFRKREIVKRVPPRKIDLSTEARQARFLFAEWALGESLYEVIWVYTDETAVQTTRHRKRAKVSVVKGSNPFNHSRPPTDTFKTVMFWGAICLGFSSGPFYIWEKETPKEREDNELLLTNLNASAQEQENLDRHQARIPGTSQHRALQELNANVRRLDREEPLPSGYPRRLRRPEWEFKQERATRDKQGKGGIDWLRYRELVLKPILYPWAYEIHRLTTRKVYIIEDNASPHTKARRWSKEERERYGGAIICIDWPPNSPDLNRIERIWDPLKDDFERLRSTQLSREAIERRLIDSWRALPQSKIDSECQRFHQKLRQCIQDGGGNNFYG